MEKKQSKKVAPKAKEVDFKSVSQSTEEVKFKASKDFGTIKKGSVYSVSKNVSEILELKGLGKQV